MNINPLPIKEGKFGKNIQQYDITLRMNDVLDVIFSNVDFRKIDGKAGFSFSI